MECNSTSYAPFLFANFSADTCFISIFSLYLYHNCTDSYFDDEVYL